MALPQSTVPLIVLPPVQAEAVEEELDDELLLELEDEAALELDDLLDETELAALDDELVVVPAYEHQTELLGALGKLLSEHNTLVVNVP